LRLALTRIGKVVQADQERRPLGCRLRWECRSGGVSPMIRAEAQKSIIP